MISLGIDPGVSGGLAALNDGDGQARIVFAVRMPETERDLLERLVHVRESTPIQVLVHATLEYVRSSPQMGVRSAFTFGRGYGAIRMALLAAGIPFDEVTPARWQRMLGCLSRGDKSRTKARAQELFGGTPGIRITHAVADALLLAEYGRRCAIGWRPNVQES